MSKAKTASKNNPDARGQVTELRKFNGKTVKPVLYINREFGKYIAAMFEDGTMATLPGSKRPVAYQQV